MYNFTFTKETTEEVQDLIRQCVVSAVDPVEMAAYHKILEMKQRQIQDLKMKVIALGGSTMTEVILDVICYLREKGKYDDEAKDLAVKLNDHFILTPKEENPQ